MTATPLERARHEARLDVSHRNVVRRVQVPWRALVIHLQSAVRPPAVLFHAYPDHKYSLVGILSQVSDVVNTVKWVRGERRHSLANRGV